MIAAIVESVIRHKTRVGALVLAAALYSVYAIRTAPLDAIPDISDPQIVVYAAWDRSPQTLETGVVEPLARSLVGAPGVAAVRATSFLGYSFIYVILENKTRRTLVQRLVTDRIDALRPELPADVRITLGPNASSMGWIYEYALVDRQLMHDPREMRLLNENQVIPPLRGVPGVAEVASVGGLVKQYQLKLFPPMLAQTGVSVRQIVERLRSAFQEVGGRAVEITNREYQIQGAVDAGNVDEIELLVVGRAPDGSPVRLRDVGYIQVGYDQRRGIADLNGKGEVVGGIVVMEQEQNVLDVNRTLKDTLRRITESLPEGVEIVPVYDRSDLIWSTLNHFLKTLAYELGVVIVVMALFLRNARTSVAPVLILLLGVLFTAIPLALLRQTINLFSLAGLFIAIGEMVDATIVIVENCAVELAARGPVDAARKRAIIISSIKNVVRPLLYSLLIILASFLPVFFLGEKESRLFNPLAYSKTFAMGFSTLLTLFVLPVIVVWVYKSDIRAPGRHGLAIVEGYRRAVNAAIVHRYAFIAVSLGLTASAVFILSGLRNEFMPELEEGSILYMPTTLPGLPAREAGWILQRIDNKLAEFPEVERVFGKLGRANTATDPAPTSMIETTILLKPKSKWRAGMTKDKLIAGMDEAMDLIGYSNAWVQPISGRVMMQDTGIQTPVGIKIKGADISVIEEIGAQVEEQLRTFPGTQSVIAERISSGYFIDVRFKPRELARSGIEVREVMPIVRYAIGGDNVVEIKQPDGAAVPLSIQYSPEYINTLDKVRDTPVVAPAVSNLKLDDIAEVAVRKIPEMMRNDGGNLAGYIYIDVDTARITPTDYVEAARAYLAGNLDLPAGYAIEWTGDYRNAAAARARLLIILPATLGIIFILLLMAFRSIADSLLIMLSVPFAFVGGIFLQWALGYAMTTAVMIGYIALFAVAIQTGIIMIVFIRQALARKTDEQSYMEAVVAGSVLRLRPKLMTVATTIFSLLPVMIATGPGSEIMKPIAAPTVGGMISSTLYVLFLIPCLFSVGQDIRGLWKNR